MPVKLNFDPDNSHPLIPVVYEEITRMVGYYRATMPATDNTKSCWVSLNEIMALITDNKANGIRIYYGRHDNNDPNYPDYSGRHNVILVSTYDAVSPINPTTQNSIDLLNYDATKGPVASVSYSGLGGDAIPLCPPRCPISSVL